MDQEQWVDLGLYASYILLGVAALAAIVMNLVNSLNNPKSLLKSGIGIVLLVAIFFIGYSMAPGEFGASTAKALESANMDPTSESSVTVYRLVGGAMTTTLALIIIAVVGLIYSSVARIVK